MNSEAQHKQPATTKNTTRSIEHTTHNTYHTTHNTTHCPHTPSHTHCRLSTALFPARDAPPLPAATAAAALAASAVLRTGALCRDNSLSPTRTFAAAFPSAFPFAFVWEENEEGSRAAIATVPSDASVITHGKSGDVSGTENVQLAVENLRST